MPIVQKKPISKAKRVKRKPLPKGSRVLVIGNGMVSAKFCEYLVKDKLNEGWEVTVLGKEELCAYDRIRLSSYVDHRSPPELELLSRDWYTKHKIALITGAEVTEISRDDSSVRFRNNSQEEKTLEYDVLVLAMGSKPNVPPPLRTDLSNIFVYRTIEDLDEIIKASEGKQHASVVGGGLLGLEAAQAIKKLGLKSTVLERSSFLMPQQLNETAAKYLEKQVTGQEIEILYNKSTKGVSQHNGRLQIEFEDESHLDTDLLIICAGIVPNSELAQEAELRTGVRGGVVVDKHLKTDDEKIFAIGECALFNGKVYGLAAPGYAMARHLVSQLSGQKIFPFEEPDMSTRLKMFGANVEVIGSPIGDGRTIEYKTDELYRMLTLDTDGTLLGALAVGEWPESGRLHTLYEERAILLTKEQDLFKERGKISEKDDHVSVDQMPDKQIICNCLRISKGQLMQCMATCGKSPDALVEQTGASTVCGSCRILVEQLCDPYAAPAKTIGYRSLIVVSALALIAALLTFVLPAPAMAQSVESWWYEVDQLWRDNLTKQITGFTLLGLSLLGVLLSLRKRLRWFRWGHFAKWRIFHSAFGVISLITLFSHTGFRFGHNLNFWLMFCFVGLNLLGAVAGIVSAVESSGTSNAAMIARRYRPAMTYAHLILFWPFPILLVFHILSVYLY